jgi:O-antigen ligase
MKVFHSYIQILLGFLGIMLGLFCVAPKLIAISLLCFFLLFVYGITKGFLKFSFSWPLFFLACFYLAYVVGVFFTEDVALANRYLENKLSFLIFPILFSFVPIQKVSLRLPFTGLLIGLCLSTILSFFNAWELYERGVEFKLAFYSSGFSYIHHPSYLTAFYILGFYAACYGYKRKWKGFSKLTLAVFGVFTLSTIYFCNSFAGLILTFLFLLSFIIITLIRKIGFKYVGLIVGGAFCVVLLIVGFNFRNGTKDNNEIVHLVESVKDYSKGPSAYVQKYKGYKTGNEVRLIMWTATFLEILNHPFGVGTGNVDIYLSKRLISMNQREMAEKEYNPHNQFLQTTLEIGVFGLFIFLTFLILSVRFALKTKNKLLGLVIVILIFNSIFESMLQRQSGIVFFSFLICLLIAYRRGHHAIFVKK